MPVSLCELVCVCLLFVSAYVSLCVYTHMNMSQCVSVCPSIVFMCIYRGIQIKSKDKEKGMQILPDVGNFKVH